MRELKGPWPPFAAALAIFAVAALVRALGLGEGLLLAATPASALALAAGVVLRARGALAAAAGFAAAALAVGLGPAAALADAATHGAAAWLAAMTMVRLARRRRRTRSRVSDWLIFLAGVAVFAAVVAAGFGLARAAGLAPGATDPRLALVFEPFGLLTFGAVLASLREAHAVRADPRPALATGAMGAALLLAYLAALRLPLPDGGPAGLALLLSLPLCLWIAMQRRSLDGAASGFLAAMALLGILVARAGAPAAPDVVTGVFYVTFLVATCQLVHAVNRDRLSALAEVERRERELEARVTERTARLAAATEAALAADAAKTRFVARVAHEVRTPLNGVLGMAALTLDHAALDPGTRRNVEVIRTSGLHLLGIVDRLLDFSRIDRPIRAADFVEIDLGALVEEVLAEARALPYASGLAFRAEIAEGLPLLRRAYRQGLRQVLTNLVGNAAKFTDRGSVTVRLAASGRDRLRIEVADTGIGMSPAAQERVFLPYERVEDASAGRPGGAGLGLAISTEIVKRLGGRIGVESTPGAGAVFWVDLAMPVAGAGAAAPASRRAVAAVAP